jgi:hypothetical protein
MSRLPGGVGQRLESGWFAAWSPFGFRLILVRACLLASGWFLIVRTSVLVLDGVDGVDGVPSIQKTRGLRIKN